MLDLNRFSQKRKEKKNKKNPKQITSPFRRARNDVFILTVLFNPTVKNQLFVFFFLSLNQSITE